MHVSMARPKKPAPPYVLVTKKCSTRLWQPSTKLASCSALNTHVVRKVRCARLNRKNPQSIQHFLDPSLFFPIFRHSFVLHLWKCIHISQFSRGQNNISFLFYPLEQVLEVLFFLVYNFFQSQFSTPNDQQTKHVHSGFRFCLQTNVYFVHFYHGYQIS